MVAERRQLRRNRLSPSDVTSRGHVTLEQSRGENIFAGYSSATRGRRSAPGLLGREVVTALAALFYFY